MKIKFLVLLVLLCPIFIRAQTNTFPASGNVGIGTVTLISTLHVGGNISLNAATDINNTYLLFQRSSDGYIGSKIGNAYAMNGYQGHLVFETNTGGSSSSLLERMRITSGGNVGIGTDVPDQKLTVKGGIGFDHNSSDKKLYSPVDGTLEWMTHEAAYKSGFAISHQGQQRVYLNINGDSYLNGGKVGIGTTSPQEILELKSSTPIQTFHMPGVASYKLGINSSGKFKIAGMDNSFGGHAGSFENSNVQLFVMDKNGNVSIGTENTPEKLSVNGKIRAHEIKVETTNWPDYVFDQDYKILGLNELDAYIKVNKHLPEMPSAKDAEANGVELGEMNKLLLKKVEELTLHIIEMNKEMKTQKQEIEILKKK